MENNREMILIRERFLESFFKDLVTYSLLVIAMFLNYKFCGNSKIMSGFFIYFILSKMISILSGKSKHCMTLKEASIQINKWAIDSGIDISDKDNNG